MRSVTVATLSLALATATPFAVPANDSRWDILPPPTSTSGRRLERLHGIGCLPGADGLVVEHGVRVEFIFQGTQLRLFGIPPPVDTQILMDDVPLANNEYLGGQAACVPFAEWAHLAATPRERHNLTILTAASNLPNAPAFLIANATGTAPDTTSPSGSATQSTLPTSTPSRIPDSAAQSDHDHSSSRSGLRPGLLIAAVLGPIVAFVLIGFAVYLYMHRRRLGNQTPTTPTRSASFKGMKETQFVMVTASTRPDTPGVVKV